MAKYKYDVYDEAIIHAGRERVWDELIAELNGAGRWWVPDNTFEPGSTPPQFVGGETRITVHTKGVDAGGLKLRFRARTTEAVPGDRLAFRYESGDFTGSGSFTLIPRHSGRQTKLAMRFTVNPEGKLKLLSKLVNMGEKHSEATAAAFRRLDALVWDPAAVLT